MIIAISGRKGCGKSTVANILENKIKNAFIYDIAFPLKKIGEILFNWNDAWLHGVYKETIDSNFNISPREFMVKLGSFIRDINKDILMKPLHKICNNNNVVIISDVRLVNEQEYLKNNFKNIVFIKIIKENNSNDDSDITESEVDLLKYDYLLHFNKDIKCLERQIEYIIENLKEI